MKLPTAIAILAATPALAHEGLHLHPHGGEAIAIGLVLAALAWLVGSRAR